MSDRRIQTVCLVVLTGLAICAALAWLRAVLVPFVLALFFAIALEPVVAWQRRRLRFPKSAAVLSTLLLGGLLLVLTGVLVSASVEEMSSKADGYQEKLDEMLTRVRAASPEWIRARKGDTFIDRVPEYARGALLGLLNGLGAVVAQGLLVLVFLLFLLLGHQTGPREGTVRYAIESGVRRYVVAKVIVSLATGVLVGAILMVLRVDLALVFGLLAFLLNFIPNVGSIISTLLPVPVVLISPELSTTAKIAALAGPAAVQFTVGSILEPQFIGKSVELHPAVIVLALIFWASLWGMVGMLLAVPLTASLKILFERLPLTVGLARLMAGSSADT